MMPCSFNLVGLRNNLEDLCNITNVDVEITVNIVTAVYRLEVSCKREKQLLST